MAILVTSIILIAGFSVLALSPFKLNNNLGLLTAIAIAIAVAIDFLLLPVLLLAFDRRRLRSEESSLSGLPPKPVTVGSTAMIFRTFIVPFLAASVLALVALTPREVLAQSAEAKGLEIAEEVERRDLGWGDSEVAFKMVLANQQGQSSIREVSIKTLEGTDPTSGDKSVVYFSQPRDLEGTAFLTHTKITDPDDQWLFLPALKRVKRISSANKSGLFLGSEFAYEDLGSQEVGKYTYRWLKDEPCGELTCSVVQRVPVYENSGYTKQLLWVDQDHYRPMRIDFYDRKDALLKTLEFQDYRQYLDKYWRAQTLAMVNHQTGKSTNLVFDEYRFQAGLSEGNFTASRLRNVR